MAQQVRTVTNGMAVDYIDAFEGRKWAHFRYKAGDEPWKWPKLIEIDGTFFQFKSFNSDNNMVHYTEIFQAEIAWIVEDKKLKPRG